MFLGRQLWFLIFALISWSSGTVLAARVHLLWTNSSSSRWSKREVLMLELAVIFSLCSRLNHRWSEIKNRSPSCLGSLLNLLHQKLFLCRRINNPNGAKCTLKGGRVSLKVPMEVISKVHFKIQGSLFFVFFVFIIYFSPFFPFSCGGKKRTGTIREMDALCQFQPHTEPDHFLLFCHNYLRSRLQCAARYCHYCERNNNNSDFPWIHYPWVPSLLHRPAIRVIPSSLERLTFALIG